ncbi:hypothetical protein B0A48_04569 [Cryoendolithus antarcticus]|uniref:non-reducing end alpha-L-arabinofuranosidase n=1 Tax=Cryoendolithus antarcticus TaxID=1507870 RepID=A0A1V8TG76_9PEZI|nr:hypothetical protein B0A48_04569 [Cryoendolithus antarcticus]
MFTKAFLTAALAAAAQAVTFTVKSTDGNATSPYAYGLMFEDINNSGDGGVYAELIRNRAFQGDGIYNKSITYWHSVGGTTLSMANLSTPLSAELTSSLQVSGGSGKKVGVYNDGFWGFPAVAAWEYQGSFYVEGSLTGNVTVQLAGNYSKTLYAETSVAVASKAGAWTQYKYSFKPTHDAPNANNTLSFTWDASAAKGAVNFNLLSLFPPTYKNRPNGNRMDLMEAMADLKPSFFRAPGGNNIEGSKAPYWWNWTQTLGPLEHRAGFPGTWGYENTDGLGLLEYAIWADDIGMELLLGIWDGLYLDGTTLTLAELQPYIQSALDEIEFLTGDASTTWGAYRESLGHGPFPLNFVEIGNEDSLSDKNRTYPAYRFKAFYDAISAKYPDLTLISSYYDVDETTGQPPYNASGDFHEYATPVQMSQQFGYFDNYTSEHPLLIGEWAVIDYNIPGFNGPVWYAGAPRAYFPFWYGSVAEAVFLLGAERNSDKIIGAAYAPGFMNLNKWEWIPDNIAYDAYPGNTILSTSYYVIKLLANTRITENLPTTEAQLGPAFWVAGRNDKTGSHILKAAVYNSTGNVPFSFNFEGVGAGAVGQLTYLTAQNMNASSTIGNNIVQTHTQSVRANRNGYFNFALPDYSVAVFEVDANNAGNGHHYGGKGNRQGWKGFKNWGKGGYGNHNQWGQPGWLGAAFVFIASILFLTTTLSAPVWNHIGLLNVHLTNGSEINFGTFGHCILNDGPSEHAADYCSATSIGYAPAHIVAASDYTRLTDMEAGTADSLTRAMILHPIISAVTFFAWLTALGAGLFGSLVSLALAGIALVLCMIVLGTDFTLFGVTRHYVNSDWSGSHAKFGEAIWCLVAGNEEKRAERLRTAASGSAAMPPPLPPLGRRKRPYKQAYQVPQALHDFACGLDGSAHVRARWRDYVIDLSTNDSGEVIDDCCWLTDADGYILNNVDGHSIAQSLDRVQARLTASDATRPTVFAINAHMSEDVSRIVDDTVEGLYRHAYRTFHTTFGREARGKLQQPTAEREVVCLTGLVERILVSAWPRSGDTVLASRVQPLPSTTQQWVPVLPSSARCPGAGPQAQVAYQRIDVVFAWMHEPPEAFLSSVLGFQDWNIYVTEPFVTRPILSTLRLRDVTEEGNAAFNAYQLSLQEVNAASRRDPSVSKVQYLLHLKECHESHASAIRQNAQTMTELLHAVSPPGRDALDAWDDLLACVEDFEYLAAETTVSIKGVSDLIELITAQVDLFDKRRSKVIGLLLAIYVPLAFATSLFGMNIEDLSQAVFWTNTTVSDGNITDISATLTSTDQPGNHAWPIWQFGVVAGSLTLGSVILPLIAGRTFRAVSRFAIRNRRRFRTGVSLAMFASVASAWSFMGYVPATIGILVSLLALIHFLLTGEGRAAPRRLAQVLCWLVVLAISALSCTPLGFGDFVLFILMLYIWVWILVNWTTAPKGRSWYLWRGL